MRQSLDAPLFKYLKTREGRVSGHPWSVRAEQPQGVELKSRLYPGEPPIPQRQTGLTLSPNPTQWVLPPRGRNAAVGDPGLQVPFGLMQAWQGRAASPTQLAMSASEQRPMGDPQGASRRGMNTSLTSSRERIPGNWSA